MALQSNFSFSHSVFLIVLGVFSAFGSSERSKTVEFDVKPGGVEHSFSDGIGDYECSFTYASQGGTNEQWLMSLGVSDDDSHFSCSVYRPQGKSYLFFTQFKAELKGAIIEHANAYSQSSADGHSNVDLKDGELNIGKSTVTQNDGVFKAQLSKLAIIGRTAHSEL